MAKAKRVLVVDDNSTNREVLQEMLEGDDFSVLEASTGHEAIRIAELKQPQIVLLDVMLPDMDGHDVCRQLRNVPGMRRARIVMVSAKGLPSERAEGLSAGADDYVVTPFDDAELMATLRVD